MRSDLVDRVGETGTTLTAAGYLPPADVEAAAAHADPVALWWQLAESIPAARDDCERHSAWVRPTPTWWSLPAWGRVTQPGSVDDEGVEPGLQPGEVSGLGLPAVSQFFRVCWNRPARALGLGVVRLALLLPDAEAAPGLVSGSCAALACGVC
jgi:hypothetical protein